RQTRGANRDIKVIYLHAPHLAWSDRSVELRPVERDNREPRRLDPRSGPDRGKGGRGLGARGGSAGSPRSAHLGAAAKPARVYQWIGRHKVSEWLRIPE